MKIPIGKLMYEDCLKICKKHSCCNECPLYKLICYGCKGENADLRFYFTTDKKILNKEVDL